MKSYLSVRQVVARLNGAVSVKLIYKLIDLGKLRVNRALGKVLVEEDSLIELMAGPGIPQTAQAMVAPRTRPRRQQRKRGVDLW